MQRRNMWHKWCLLATAGIVLGMVMVGCSDDDSGTNPVPTNPLDEMILLGEAVDGTSKIEFYSIDTMRTSRNDVYFQVSISDVPTSDGSLTINPLMTMASMTHSCPFQEPLVFDVDNNIYHAEIVFVMPSGAMGTWDINTEFTLGEDVFTPVLENITVLSSEWLKTFSYDLNDSTAVNYYITLDGLENPVVGTNDVVMTISYKASMMSFPMTTDHLTTIDTFMPSMGHGSEGNVAPGYTSNGHYEGVVGFSMSGDWEVTFEILDLKS